MSTKKVVPKTATTASGASNRVQIPGSYRPKSEDIEASLKTLFTAEEMAEMDKIDYNNLPVGSKSLSEMINEDREDRL